MKSLRKHLLTLREYHRKTDNVLRRIDSILHAEDKLAKRQLSSKRTQTITYLKEERKLCAKEINELIKLHAEIANFDPTTLTQELCDN